MSIVEVSTVLRLRRDNDYNYDKIKDAFIPAKGEICLVDTAKNGLRMKIGNGITTFANLDFYDKDLATNIIIRGYFYNNIFYYDANHENVIESSVNKIYIDAIKNKTYIYNGVNYVDISQDIPIASETTAGTMKLYQTTGNNIDGTMSQKAITDELNEKFEVEIDSADEEIVFLTNLF